MLRPPRIRGGGEARWQRLRFPGLVNRGGNQRRRSGRTPTLAFTIVQQPPMRRSSTLTRWMLQGGTWLIATFFLVVLVRGVDVGRVWGLGQEAHGAWIAAAIAS